VSVLILDLEEGNLSAFERVLKDNKIEYYVGQTLSDLESCSHVILPGVGDFAAYRQAMINRSLYEPLRNFQKDYPDKFLLGVCVGMQILATQSEEGDGEGLALIPGLVKRLPSKLVGRVPHMGWNSVALAERNVDFSKVELQLVRDIDLEMGFYFLHSYQFEVTRPECQILTANYNFEFSALVGSGNVFGAQFHPEKSHISGLTFLTNFCGLQHA
jgi:glutamine amidotransferase